MPSKKTMMACIHCGLPSDTVVCMSCFFKYKSEPLQIDPIDAISNPCVNRSEYKPSFKSEFLSELESDIVPELQEENESVSWFQEDITIKPEPEKKEEEPKQEKDSPVSWFSRLPRF